VLQSTQTGENVSEMAIDNPLAKLQMTVRFYHPSLIEYIARMENASKTFTMDVELST
jgi:hypothetical protein